MSVSDSTNRFTKTVQKGARIFLNEITTNINSAPTCRQRIMDRVSATIYAPATNGSNIQYTNSTTRSNDNTVLIPELVYGIKY